jgi:hypothetical protein
MSELRLMPLLQERSSRKMETSQSQQIYRRANTPTAKRRVKSHSQSIDGDSKLSLLEQSQSCDATLTQAQLSLQELF